MAGRTIGLDYDHKRIAFIRDAILNIKRNYSPEWIKLSISPSGRGFHVRFKTTMDLTDKQCLLARKFLGDDPYRISVIWDEDNSAWIYRDVLFDAKMVDGKFYSAVPIDVDEFLKYGKEVPL